MITLSIVVAHLIEPKLPAVSGGSRQRVRQVVINTVVQLLIVAIGGAGSIEPNVSG